MRIPFFPRTLRVLFVALCAASILLEPGSLPAADASPGLPAAPRPSPAVTFHAAIGSDVTGMDPALLSDADSLQVTSQIYDTLVSLAPGGSVPGPGLAQTWSLSNDHLTWSFDLRSGVKFHDGTNLDADAVVFNFQRWWDPTNPYHTGQFTYFATLFGGYKGDANCLISNVSANGASQVLITLKRPYSPLVSILAFPALAIASPTAIQAGSLNTSPVGSGPFRFVAHVSGDHVELAANPNYWAGKPQLDSLFFQVVPSAADRLAALQAGSLQSAGDLPATDASAAAQNPSLRLLWRPDVWMGYLGINQAHKPLDNPLVRQAIAHAINKAALIANHYGDAYGYRYQAATQMLPSVVWGYGPGVGDYSYNPQLARQLLAQAGYPSGFSTTIAYRDVPRAYLPDAAGTAAAIHDYLQAVGINATVQLYESSTFLTKVNNGELDLFLMGWTPDLMHPYNYFAPHFCGGLGAAFGPSDDTLCSQLDTALGTGDFAGQLAIYRWSSQRVHDTLPLVPLANGLSLLIDQRNVVGLYPSPLGMESYTPVAYASAWTYLPLLRR